MKIFLLIIINYAVWNTGICDTWLHHKTNAILCLELHNNWRPPVFTKCLFNENCYVSSLSGPLMAPVLQQVLQRCWNIWHWKQNIGLNTHHLTHSPAPTDISHFSLLVLLAKYMQLAWLLFSDKQESWVVKAKHSKICWVWFPEPAGMRVHAHNQAIEVQTGKLMLVCILMPHSFSQKQIQTKIKSKDQSTGNRNLTRTKESTWTWEGGVFWTQVRQNEAQVEDFHLFRRERSHERRFTKKRYMSMQNGKLQNDSGNAEDKTMKHCWMSTIWAETTGSHRRARYQICSSTNQLVSFWSIYGLDLCTI